MPNISNLLLENYDTFIKENDTLFEEALTSASVITDDSYFDMYIDKLTEGLEESYIKRLRPILDREREMYIEEATSILSSPQAIAYAVASFPMLINIYTDPILAKVVTVFPTDKPTMSIPRLRWIAKVIDEQGNATEHMFPSATEMIRPQYKLIEIGQNANLFNLLNVTKGDFRISKRNFRLSTIKVKIDGTDKEIAVDGQADARGNIVIPGIVLGDSIGKLQGQIDFDNGSITWSSVLTTVGADTVEFLSATTKFRIFGNGNGRGVVKSYPKQDIIDVDADIEDSFEVENLEEIIQDWKALYNINILAELKNHVKDQIKLNRDFEIAELLESNVPTAKSIGQFTKVNLSSFIGADGVRPTSVQDIFKNIMPPITMILEKMKRQNNMDVQYLVCGYEVAAILKSMQEYSISMSGQSGTTGSIGGGTGSSFNKLEIIESYAIEPQMVHLITGASTLGQSSIVQVLYKPLYIISEITNSIRRTFIKSRTWIGIVRAEGLGSIELEGYDNYFGNYAG